MKRVLAWMLTGMCGVALAQDATAGHPFFRTEEWPRWSAMTPEQLKEDTEAALAETSRQVQAICSLKPEAYTFENTFLAYTRVGEQLKQVQALVSHLLMACPTEEMRNAQAQMLDAVVQFGARHVEDNKIEQTILAAAKAPWVEQLPEEKQRYVLQVLQKLKESGAGLSPEQLSRKTWLEKELQQLYRQFSRNLAQSLWEWQLIITNPAELEGMPQDWLEQSAAAARAAGYGTESAPAWLVNLPDCPAADVLIHCHVEETRRRCWEGVTSEGTAHAIDNEPLLRRAMEQRQELAGLMGYRHFADMQAARRMMGTGEQALDLVDELLAACKPAFDAEVAAYLAELSKVKGEAITRIEPWNERYYARHIPPREDAFSVSRLTPYFSAERVIGGMLQLGERLLGVRITEQKTCRLRPGEQAPEGSVEVWHPQVRAFTVHDAANGQHLGSFYMDLYPRAGKQAEAWCMPLQLANPGPAGEIREPNLAALMANIPAPDEGAHLLHHRDVTVLFHEFGHLMHMMLGHAPLPGQHAMNMEQDFMEMPSLLMEYWAWEPEALATFAFHFQTGESLPTELAEKLAASRKRAMLRPFMSMLRVAKVDLEMNMHYSEKFRNRPLDEAADELLAPWQMPYTCPLPCELRSTMHTMSPAYAASFYTYPWSELLARDAFSRFRKEGILNPATGADYRKRILEPGSSKPARQLFRDFMGRDPDPAAMQQVIPVP